MRFLTAFAEICGTFFESTAVARAGTLAGARARAAAAKIGRRSKPPKGGQHCKIDRNCPIHYKKREQMEYTELVELEPGQNEAAS